MMERISYLALFLNLIGLLTTSSLWSVESVERIKKTELQFTTHLQKAQDYLILSDGRSALAELASLHGEEAERLRCLSYALCNDERAMITSFFRYLRLAPSAEKRDLLAEKVAWAILETGYSSHSLERKHLALIAAFFLRDSRSVLMVEAALDSPLIAIRSLAIELAKTLADLRLQHKLESRLKVEESHEVRLLLIDAVMELNLRKSRPKLMEIAFSERSIEERGAAVKALANLFPGDKQLIQKLSSLSHPLLKLAFISSMEEMGLREESEDHLFVLLQDPHRKVREELLRLLLRRSQPASIELQKKIEPFLQDEDPFIRLHAAAFSLFYFRKENEATQIFQRSLKGGGAITKEAVSLLSLLGKRAHGLIRKAIHEVGDSTLRLQLIIALFAAEVDEEEAFSALQELLLSQRPLIPSHLAASATLSPFAMQQTLVFELLKLMALRNHPAVLSISRSLLERTSFSLITSLATLYLLDEGEMARDLFSQLLKDPNPKIRLEAAIALGLWKLDREAISLLQEAFPQAPRASKERILEAIGRIGGREALTFLLPLLEERHSSLRLHVAFAILLALNS